MGFGGYLDGHTEIEELRYAHDHEFSLEIPRARAQDGPHVQGVLNLLENLEEDGGTQLVPGWNGVIGCDSWGSYWRCRGGSGMSLKYR